MRTDKNKKYKINTDELDWKECRKGDTIQWNNDIEIWETTSSIHYPLFSNSELQFFLKHHPNWFDCDLEKYIWLVVFFLPDRSIYKTKLRNLTKTEICDALDKNEDVVSFTRILI
jgi:hypothetical protein